MGISSNQSRLMTLTARQHDLELRAQQISAKKMITSMESQQMATEYSDALNTYSMMKSGELQKDKILFNYIFSDPSGKTYSYSEAEYTKEQIDKFVKDYNLTQRYSTIVGKTQVNYTDDQCADFLRKAQADYDGATAKLSAEEKQLDMELTQINTEHNAVKTEYDAVKSLVSDNTDKSFNVFS